MKRTFIKRILPLFTTLALLFAFLPAAAAQTQYTGVYLNGKVSRNISTNSYDVWASPVRSYISQTETGAVVRVCATQENKLLAEWYNAAGKLQRQKEIAFPMMLFGGFFFGENNYYAVFGQNNLTEDENADVLCLVKYDKDMNEKGRKVLKGLNTYKPFEAGSCRFAETNEKLYVYTCHEMFISSDGYRHQANMTLIFGKNDLTLQDFFFDMMNIGYCGYVSHSFNQFIATDGDRVYRADHGDAFPRGFSITVTDANSKMGNNVYTVPITFVGGIGDNATGATLGGMAVTESRILLAGTIDRQTKDSIVRSSEQKNVIVTASAKSLAADGNRVIRITEYAPGDNVRVGTPHLTAINKDTALLTWEETPADTGVTVVKAVALNAMGAPKKEIATLEARLSDCAPTLAPDGSVIWYVSSEESVSTANGTQTQDDGRQLILYRINPNDPGSFTPLTHNWQIKQTLSAVTCEKDGRAIFRCPVCGEEKTDVIPATGHDWSEWAFLSGDLHARVCANDETHVQKAAHAWKQLETQTDKESGTTTTKYLCETCRIIKTVTSTGAGSENQPSPTPMQTEQKDLRGDVNMDGKVNASDARLALRAAVKLENVAAGTQAFKNADTDKNGKITAADARLILRAAVKLITL